MYEGEYKMLVEFRVKNFKNFEEDLIFKLDKVKNYEFNLGAVADNVVNTALVYGRNGSGKSNLGLAIMDISEMLTDKEKNKSYGIKPYSNLSVSESEPVRFYYKFKFDSSYLTYIYEKKSSQDIVKEEIFINENRIIQFDHTINKGEVLLLGAETLNTDLNDKNISFVKYINNNTILVENEENLIFEKFLNFVDNMLLFSSLENNHYQGFKAGSESVAKGIIEKGKLKDFEIFLNKAGLKYNLSEVEIDGQKNIFCNFGEKKANFYSIASRGTCTLALFYYWSLDFDKVSMVFIDEFDAFYHNELARLVVKSVMESNVQSIVTTHNTSIMDNDLMRPDCYFILENNHIESFAFLTKKELRKAHNIEKMYRAGSFDE